MTPKEMQIALNALRVEVGPKADVSCFIQDRVNAPAIYASISPRGIGTASDHGHLVVKADDFEEALTKLRALWSEHSAQFRAKAVRKMALAVITITAEQGHCTDAALRGDDFSAADVRAYGAEACATANEMAGKGPFAIVVLGGANGAPAEAGEGASVPL